MKIISNSNSAQTYSKNHTKKPTFGMAYKEGSIHLLGDKAVKAVEKARPVLKEMGKFVDVHVDTNVTDQLMAYNSIMNDGITLPIISPKTKEIDAVKIIISPLADKTGNLIQRAIKSFKRFMASETGYSYVNRPDFSENSIIGAARAAEKRMQNK